MDIELTDPASEMANVITVLLEQPSSNDPTWSIFQKAIGQNISSKDYWHAISILRSRVDRLEGFVKSVDDTEFRHGQQRDRLLHALHRFQGAFDPARQMLPWQQVLSQNVIADDGLQLGVFSYIARRLWPLRRLSEADRQNLIQQIDAVLADMGRNHDVPSWAKAPLVDGLIRLQLSLKHLLFFGYEAAIDDLHNLYQKTIAVEDIVAAEGQGESKQSKSIMQVLGLLAVIGALFCLPNDATTAFERYQGWYLRVVTNSPRLPKPEQRLLPAPAAIEAQPPSEEEKLPGS